MKKHTPTPPVLSAVSGTTWPSLPSAPAAAMLAVQYQLEQSQWLPPHQLLVHQFAQIQALIDHARHHVPFYQPLFNDLKLADATPITQELWQRIPLLSRAQLQKVSAPITSRAVPKDHGGTAIIQTSGSTGTPVTIHTTSLAQFFWKAITLSDHLWHQRDFSAKLVAIRPEGNLQPGQTTERQGWGQATDGLFASGPSAALSVRTPVDEQAAWLRRQAPAYFLSLPSNIAALAKHFLKNTWQLPGLREVRTYGELLDDTTRELCQQAWAVPVTDMYSAQEVGYIALQCPEYGNYHVQAENLLVEIINQQGTPCSLHEIGQVVLTPLHNFAMPLFRYAIGDYAAFGPPCPCGRGLPVLQKIAGRQRNMLRLPDGRQHWPSFPAELWAPFPAIRQFQLVQPRSDTVTVRLIAEPKLTPGEEQRLTAALCERFGYPLSIVFEYPTRIERSASGKFEDFISEVVG